MEQVANPNWTLIATASLVAAIVAVGFLLKK